MYTWRLTMRRRNLMTRINIRAGSGEEALTMLDSSWDDWAVIAYRRIG